MKSWIEFWNAEHSIYVNNVHKLAHAKKIYNDMCSEIQGENYSILDFGCGEALYAEGISKKCAELVVMDTSCKVRKLLMERTRGVENITITNNSDLLKFEDEKFDLIVVNSVFQYLNKLETIRALELFHRILKHNGKLIIADIIPPNLSILSDVFSLLRFSIENAFFLSAIVGLFKTYISDYKNLRKQIGLSVYSSDQFIKLLSNSNFVAELESQNFGHNQKRCCFRATKSNKKNNGLKQANNSI